MKVLVTGASGFVGEAVVERLRSEPYLVRALQRHLPAHARGQQQMEWYLGDVTRAESLPQAMEGLDAVIHLVGIISESRSVSFEQVHREGTRNVLRAMTAAGVKRLVHMSALGTRPAAVSRYHRTKWAAEESVRASGLDWTIFRPSLIYGRADHFTNMFAKLARTFPVLPVMGKGTARFAPVHSSAVAEAFVRSLGCRESFHRTFDLCGPELLTLPEMLRYILAAQGRKRRIIRFPMPLARLQAAVLEFVFGGVFDTPPPLNRDQLIMLDEDNVGNPGPANELFSLQHPVFGAAIGEYVR